MKNNVKKLRTNNKKTYIQIFIDLMDPCILKHMYNTDIWCYVTYEDNDKQRKLLEI